MKLSIIVPAYNEEKTIKKVVDKLKKVKISGIEMEVIVVDDNSTDSTFDILSKIKGIKVLRHSKNKGKGGAVASGLKAAKGSILVIQDADLEYNPKDIPKLVKPIVAKRAEVVFGSRNLGGRSSYSSLFFYLGGLFIEWVSNLILGTKITDSITGSKAFTRKVYKKISPIKSTGFEIEAEITAKVVKKGFKIFEVPIKYKARTVDEGKKIRWHHAFEILKTTWRYSR